MNYRPFTFYFSLFTVCFLLFTFYCSSSAFSDSYTFLEQWGDGPYPGNIQLSKPRGVAVAQDGTVYVSGSAQNAVFKYSINQPGGSVFVSLCAGTYLNNPMEMAVDNSGKLYVVDNGNNRVCVYNASGTYLRKIESGFNAPVGVAVDSDLNVYVTDRRNNVVKKFNSSGTLLGLPWTGFRAPWGITVYGEHVYVTDGTLGGMVHKLNKNGTRVMKADGITPLTWGPRGTGTGQFLMAEGIAAYSNLLYVSDGEYGRIHVFDLDGNYQRTIGERGTGNGQLQFSTALAVGNGGWLYVSDDDNDRVVVFNLSWSPPYYAGQWGCDSSGATGLRYPTKIAIDKARGVMYVVDSANHKIRKMTLNPVGEILSFGGYGNGDGEFRFPIDAAVDSGGNVHVVDNLKRNVKKFSPGGAFIQKYDFNQPPLLTDSLAYLYGLQAIAIDSSDKIYVVDAGTNSVHVLDATGKKIGNWAVNDYPTGIAIDEDAGFVYVTSFGPDTAAQYNMSGAPTGKLIGQGNADPFNNLFHPYGVTVDAGGNVLIADTFRNRLNKFGTNGPTGNFITTIGTLNWAGDDTPGQFTFPYGVALDNKGYVYAADTNNHRIQVLKPAPFSFTKVIQGSGNIECSSPTVNYGAQQTCTLAPTAGYYLASLTDNGQQTGIPLPDNVYTLANVASDHAIAATFRPVQTPRIRSGNIYTPWATIAAAFDNAHHGDAVELQSRAYSENNLLFAAGSDITLRGGVDFVLNTQSGYSIINPLTIGSGPVEGSVVIDGIIIQ